MDDQTTRTICEDWDRLAKEYARRLFDELRYKPFDCALLDRFAAEVGPGEVCDMGCGPGHVARYLKQRGVSVLGLDLSPEMLEQARKLNPDISFREGNMMSLDIPKETLAGITAFYAIVNIPAHSLPAVFEQMARVLKPNGLLLLAFHVGNEVLQEHELWGYKISMDFLLFPSREVGKYLEESGFTVDEIIEREPYPEIEHQSRRAYVLARKRVE
jgi:ubiquinone/menaquinone biosynthesis C-methylase UbiE